MVLCVTRWRKMSVDILQVDKVKEVVGSGKKENDAMPPQSRKTKKKKY